MKKQYFLKNACLEDILHDSENCVVFRCPKDLHLIAALDFEFVQTNIFPQILKQTPLPTQESLSFQGWIGWISYDFLAGFCGVTTRAKKELSLPDCIFIRPITLIHEQDGGVKIETLCNFNPPKNKNISFCEPFFQIKKIKRADSSSPITCNFSQDSYKKAFLKAKEHILDGDTYQIKISMRYQKKGEISPVNAFFHLFRINPSPQAFLFHTKEFSLISCSPESVIAKNGNKIITKPIGGTWNLEKNKDSNMFLKNTKEIHEHNMLVDLERNDLSRVCLPGSVKINLLRDVETYRHLLHLVTTIEGTMNPNFTNEDLIRAMLPGGTITGCPKIRTMELIDQIEPCAREFYTGSFGLFHDNGDLNMNLIIRTLLYREKTSFIQSGGGIVIDSDPFYEYNENIIKAKALLEILA